jgi:hypothetical protein
MKRASASSNGSRAWRLTSSKVVTLAREYLEPHQSKDFRLELLNEAERQPDGWWYVYFRPSREGLKSYEYEGRVIEAMQDLMEKEKANVVFLEESVAHS